MRRWISYASPKINDPKAVDKLMLISQADAEKRGRHLARYLSTGVFPA